MLNPDQIAAEVGRLDRGELSLQDFEVWFRQASRNFHAYPDGIEKSAIFEVEDVFSQYHFDSLEECAVPRELATAIRPFVKAVTLESHVVSVVLQPSAANSIRPVSDFQFHHVWLNQSANDNQGVYIGTRGGSNSTDQRIPPQRETTSAFGVAPASPALFAAAV